MSDTNDENTVTEMQRKHFLLYLPDVSFVQVILDLKGESLDSVISFGQKVGIKTSLPDAVTPEAPIQILDKTELVTVEGVSILTTSLEDCILEYSEKKGCYLHRTK